MCELKGCSCFEILLSIVIGAVVAALFAFRLIPFIISAVWVGIVLAIVILLALVIILLINPRNQTNTTKCKVRILRCLITAAIGTLILGLIAISIAIIPVLIVSIIVIFLFIVFLSLLIITIIALLRCLLERL